MFKHPTRPTDSGKGHEQGLGPNMRLLGHEKEGYGLAWNPNKIGVLASGSDDGRVFLWDINSECKD
jgi:histone-binding protein RBBP4